MKKSHLLTALLACLVCFAAVFAACGDNSSGEHVHSFTQNAADAACLKTAASCEDKAVYYYSCECGEISADKTFEYGEPLGHREVTVKGTAPTCTGKGLSDGTACEVCGKTLLAGQEIAAKGHEWNDGEITQPATCTVSGIKTYTCAACGETRTETVAAGHIIVNETVEATCTGKGYVIDKCTRCDYIYYVSETAPAGHEWKGELTCETGRECGVCGKTEEKLGHIWTVSEQKEADCISPAKTVYSCDRCSGTYEVPSGDALGHNLTGAEMNEVPVSGEKCLYRQVYACVRCGSGVEGAEVYHHRYTASITKEATCVADGVKTFTCGECGAKETETVGKNENGHIWSEGTLSGVIRTYNCKNAGCGKTKTAVDASQQQSAEVSNADLASAGEVRLKDASLGLDEKTLERIGGKDVTLSADTLDGEELEDVTGSLTEEQKAQLGSGSVYNFTMSASGSVISDFGGGEITVTVPYTLSEGEDADSIAIWFIEGDKLVSIKAEYSNGYVTFKTGHFSYYTVTRLTPKERCSLYGHNTRETVYEASCTKDGYTLVVCIRCGYSDKTNEIKASGHDYKAQITAPTCTEDGLAVYTCATCGNSYNVTSAAPGHSKELVSSAEATCAAPGFKKYVCRQCDKEFIEELPQLMHDYKVTVHGATCTEKGYTESECVFCGYSFTGQETDVVPHSYTAEWEFSADKKSATAVFTCAYGCDFRQTVPAVVAVTHVPATCTQNASADYTASVVFEGEKYTETVSEITGEKLEHVYGDWIITDEEHCRECTVCGEKTETEKHSFADGACTVCGKEGFACDHETLKKDFITNSGYDVCTFGIPVLKCECGKVCDIDFTERGFFLCDMNEEYEESTEIIDGIEYEKFSAVCGICGAYLESISYEGETGCVGTLYGKATMRLGEETLFDLSGTYSEEYHGNIVPLVIKLDEYGGCGGEITVGACKDCGKIISPGEMSLDTLGCEMGDSVQSEETDENGIVRSVMSAACTVCGTELKMSQWKVKLSECEYEEHYELKMTAGGKTVFVISESERDSEHGKIVKTYQPGKPGETEADCSGSYIVTETCSRCGMYYMYRDNGHDTEYVKIDMSEYTPCGGTIEGYRCGLCGVFTYLETNAGCKLGDAEQSTITDENGVDHMLVSSSCSVCGLRYEGDRYVVNDGPCRTITVTEYVLGGDGVVLSFTEKKVSTNHKYEYTYILDGGTCGDGYTVNEVCTVCGEASSWENSGHRYEYKDISLNEYDCCGGSVAYEMCKICGNIRDVEVYSKCSTITEKEEFTDTDGKEKTREIITCQKCGLEIVTVYYTESEKSCYFTEYRTVAVTVGGTEIISGEAIEEYIEHDFEYTVDVTDGDCTNGWTATVTCAECGYNYQDYGNDHDEFIRETYILSDYGVCGGTLESSICPCGKHSSYSHYIRCDYNYNDSSYTENGIEYETESYTCNICNLRLQETVHKEKVEGECLVKSIYAVVLTVNDALVLNKNFTDVSAGHDYEISVRYKNPAIAVSCEDGIIVTHTCKDCGYSYDYEENYCYTFIAEDIDLADYGCVCGGRLLIERCLCGKRNGYSFTNTECDLDYAYRYNWEKDAIPDGSDNVEERYFSNYCETYTCSVTDPACGCCYFTGRYWKKVPGKCLAERYYVIKLGYDRESGSCQREIVISGETEKYHYVEQSDYSERTENGYAVSEYAYRCEYCDSYRLEKTYYLNDERVKYTEECRLYNEDGSSELITEEYFYYKGRRYESKIYSERSIDGQTEWEKREYEYDFAAGCSYVCRYTSSGGYSDTSNGTCHYERNATIKEPTCTQFGLNGWKCTVCEQVLQSTVINPVAHEWDILPDKTYYCVICGLMNANGASGAVVMEDFTEQYGGDYYVVGYWNRGTVQYIYSVGIVPHVPAADGDDIIILDGITVTERTDISAVEFSKSAVGSAAALMGYAAGTYDVRFAFVPLGGDGTLDYAVTLTEPEKTITEPGLYLLKKDAASGQAVIEIKTNSPLVVTVISVAGAGDPYAVLKDGGGNVIAGDDDSGEGMNFALSAKCEPGKSYYLTVSRLSGAVFVPVYVSFGGDF